MIDHAGLATLGGAVAQLAALAAGTFASEDLTCISAGMLIRRGLLTPAAGVLGCFIGIVAGDLGLWAAGRFLGRRLLDRPWVARRLPPGSLGRAATWLEGNLPKAVLASRFLPATRLPMYFAAGVVGGQARRFALWTLIAAAIWTPLVVLASASIGEAFTAPFQKVAGSGWLASGAAAAALFVLYRTAAGLLTAAGRGRLIARVSRLWRWEFWPAWVFYPPVTVWIALLSIRYRRFNVITAANPAMPDGGFVGESKHHILSTLPRQWILPAVLIGPGALAERVETLERIMRENGWRFPLILKPDAGQRGAGVKCVRDRDEAAACLSGVDGPIIAQVYHPGPYEAGVFYYRMPGEASGRIFSITDKRFPEVVGDGASTVEDLIWMHPRHRMQARTFLARHAQQRAFVPARGERFPLCMAGNHVQGTMFLDGRHLLTPELERTVDQIARSVKTGSSADGFFFGRFDIRYASVERFKAGRDFAIVELNGVTSESTDIYDPSGSLLKAYRTLFRQWALLFRIGELNRRRGVRVTPLRELAANVRAYYRRSSVPLLAD
ncbi:MAG TPA: VTT domain-containing protein [Candidatus Polarisedimenticolia bacterium]|nr:VTT domain-containing protein [Candidatus Polarisedimenticolia bacterium]